MNGNKQEWIVGYHGFPYNDENIMKSVIDNNFKKGPRQAYRYSKCVKTQEQIGTGVYFSPHVEVAEIYC